MSLSSQIRDYRKLPVKFFPGAPDLAVEILLPDDRQDEVRQKVLDYLQGGARLVWVISPEERSAAIYHSDRSTYLVRENEALDGEDVLPGLAIPLSQLF